MSEPGSCKCCMGSGIQYCDKTGLRVRCPECDGTGDWTETEMKVGFGTTLEDGLSGKVVAEGPDEESVITYENVNRENERLISIVTEYLKDTHWE